MNKIIIDKNFFDKNLESYEIKPLVDIFKNIGGIIRENELDCSKICDKINIEIFYNLEPKLRAIILKQILDSESNCCSWSLHMMHEIRNISMQLRPYYSFPRTYKLNYNMSDKSNDIIIKEILLHLKIELENNIVKSKSNLKSDKNKIDKKKKKTIPPSLKIKIWNKHIGDEIGKTKCLCCKMQDIYQASFSCGHIISEFNGGELKLENLKPICKSCNSSMGTKNMDEYIKEFGF